jgi:hypothetical protein
VSKTAVNIDRILERIRRIEQLLEERSFNEARDLALELVAATNRAGIRSPHLHWLLAVIHDQLQELVPAFSYIQEAVSMDPLAPPLRHSVSVIAAHIRAVLKSPERLENDESIPRLWEILARNGEADDDTHVVMARYQLATSNALEALRLLDAVTTLTPGCEQAWALKVAVAVKLGDRALAERAAAEAAAIGAEPVQFLIPGRAEA